MNVLLIMYAVVAALIVLGHWRVSAGTSYGPPELTDYVRSLAVGVFWLPLILYIIATVLAIILLPMKWQNFFENAAQKIGVQIRDVRSH